MKAYGVCLVAFFVGKLKLAISFQNNRNWPKVAKCSNLFKQFSQELKRWKPLEAGKSQFW